MTLRILHVVESSAPEAGTPAVLLDGLDGALRARSVESTVMTLNGTAADRLAEADVIHFHGWGLPAAYRLAAASHRAGKPCVISPLGAMSNDRFPRRGWRRRALDPLRDARAVRRAAAVTASGRTEYDAIRRRFAGCDIRLLDYGITTARYESNGAARAGDAPHGLRTMLLLGPVEPAEGLLPLVRSLDELAGFAEGWDLVVAGRDVNGWSRGLAPLLSRWHWSHRVRFCSAPDVESQRALLAESSLLVAPSFQTRCPASVLQAAAAGVPVVTSAYTVPYALEEVVSVFGTERVELKIELRRMLGLSGDERRHMAERARRTVRDRVDWDRVVDDYLQLYRSFA